MATRPRLVTRLRQESGLALTELVVASSILVVVLSATLALLDSAVLQAPQDQERAHVVRDAQSGLYRMTRELRQAYQVNGTPTASQVDVNVNVLGTARRVRYRCDQAHPTENGAYRCMRELMTSGGAVSSTTIAIDRISNSSVFSYTPSAAAARHVEAEVALAAKGERKAGYTDSFVLSDGFLLRNL